MKKKIIYWSIGLFIFCGWADLVWGQQTFTQEEALQMIKQRDAQWEGKIEKADSLIASQKVVISDCENLVTKLEESTTVDSLLLEAKDAQITLLKVRDEANEKLVKLVEPKWYESTYIWLAAGFIIGLI
tara:strand:+ start:58 stop:444 length:387 start_codon:yes stop_codon:yes gene_type:complete